MKKIKILIIEDNDETVLWLDEYLKECGFLVDSVSTATDALSHIKHSHYDLILLDLNLPDFDGFEVLKKIKYTSSLPVIIISGDKDVETKVVAFKYGASDYMTKPLALKELEARIWSLLGRNTQIELPTQSKVFVIEGSIIYFLDTPLKLTSMEFEILSTLIEYQNMIVTREMLAQSCSSFASQRSFDYHIKNIRKKLTHKEQVEYLKTIYGQGYMLSF